MRENRARPPESIPIESGEPSADAPESAALQPVRHRAVRDLSKLTPATAPAETDTPAAYEQPPEATTSEPIPTITPLTPPRQDQPQIHRIPTPEEADTTDVYSARLTSDNWWYVKVHRDMATPSFRNLTEISHELNIAARQADIDRAQRTSWEEKKKARTDWETRQQAAVTQTTQSTPPPPSKQLDDTRTTSGFSFPDSRTITGQTTGGLTALPPARPPAGAAHSNRPNRRPSKRNRYPIVRRVAVVAICAAVAIPIADYTGIEARKVTTCAPHSVRAKILSSVLDSPHANTKNVCK